MKILSNTRRYSVIFLGCIVLLGISSVLLLAVLMNYTADSIFEISWPRPHNIPFHDYLYDKTNSSEDSPKDHDGHEIIDQSRVTAISAQQSTPTLPPKVSPSTTTPLPAATKVSETKYFTLVLRNETLSPDGNSRNVLTINHHFPGPSIIVNKGDTVNINVTNFLGVPTSIHVHGIDQWKTPFMDGMPYVTQCPLEDGKWFVYEFVVSESGTYWYYATYETQRIDGLYGALVVMDSKEEEIHKYEYEKIILLSDWYHEQGGELLRKYISENVDEPIPRSTLINGKGILNCNGSIENFYLETGKSYRLRVINS
ncbi:2806_t:CDS:2, partial [Acaulospora morrowiae]